MARSSMQVSLASLVLLAGGCAAGAAFIAGGGAAAGAAGLAAAMASALWFVVRVMLPLGRLQATITEVASGRLEAERRPAANENLFTACVEPLYEIVERERKSAVQARRQAEVDVVTRSAALQARVDQVEAELRGRADLMASVGQQIRSPLSGVLSMADLLAETELPEVQMRRVEVIRSAGRNLLKVVDDLVDIGSAEAGKLRVDQVAYRARDVIDNVLHEFSDAASRKGLRLTWALDRRLADPAMGDPQRIEQILTNLTANAIQFTDRGGVEIRAEFVGEDVEERKLDIRVRDTGKGIPADQLENVFRPFQPVGGKPDGKPGAPARSGLGLAVVQQLVDAMRGQIQVQSESGRGSEFRVVLPAPPPDRSDPQTRPALLGDARAMVAVADELLQSELVNQLEFLGIETRVILAPDVDTFGSSPRRDDFVFADSAAWVAMCPFGPPTPAAAKMAAFLVVALGSANDASLPAGVSRRIVAPWRENDLWQQLGDAEAQARESAQSAEGRSDNKNAGPASVLVVDDDPIGGEVLKQVLEAIGVRVRLLRNGADAHREVREQGFDAIFMDLRLPRLDGFEAVGRIRRSEQRNELAPSPRGPRRWSRIPLVAVSAVATPGDREHCLASGFDDYLVKPVQVATLRALLRRWTGLLTRPPR